MLRLGWFSTGRGPGSRDLLRVVMEKRQQGLIDVEISFVFCNWDNTEIPNSRKEQREMFFDMVRGYDIPLITASWKDFMPEIWKSDPVTWRNEYGKLIREKTSQYEFDLGVLAGYMLWIDDDTCKAYNMINLHPALPDGPKGTWEDVIWTLIAERAERHGVMIHLCTEEWDRGAAMTYCEFPIVGKGYDTLWKNMDDKQKTMTIDEIREREGVEEPLFKKIREDGAKRELPLIVSTLGIFAKDKIEIVNKRLMCDGKVMDDPFDMTRDVDGGL